MRYIIKKIELSCNNKGKNAFNFPNKHFFSGETNFFYLRFCVFKEKIINFWKEKKSINEKFSSKVPDNNFALFCVLY